METDTKNPKDVPARRIDAAKLPPETPDLDVGNVEQSQELTQEVFGENEQVNDGVGPQPDEHRGNAQGGFKYERLPREEEQPTKEEEPK